MLSQQLDEKGIPYEYETQTILYEGKPRRYRPDFILESGVIVEAKGRFTASDRAKHLLIKKQHPDLDIRFVFQSDNMLTKASNTRYSDWCAKHGFEYAFNEIPEEWSK